MLNVNVSKETEQILEDLAAQNNENVADFAGKILEKEIAKNDAANNGKSKTENPPVKTEKRYMRMKGMFKSDKTDTSERMSELLRAEIGRNGFGDFEK